MQSDFYARIAPYAQQASRETGIPAQAIAAQWAHETGYGKSPAAGRNNYAGIMTNSSLRAYDSLATFVTDYVKVANHHRYDAARGSDPVAALAGLGAGGWDDAHYRGPRGQDGELVKGVLANDSVAINQAIGVAAAVPPGMPGVAPITQGKPGEQSALETIAGLPGAVADIPGKVADAASNVVPASVGDAFESIGTAFSTITSLAFWKRAGLLLGGLLLIIMALAVWKTNAAKSVLAAASADPGKTAPPKAEPPKAEPAEPPTPESDPS